MAEASQMNLSRRERQIMDILYQRGKSSASEVLEAMPDRPGEFPEYARKRGHPFRPAPEFVR